MLSDTLDWYPLSTSQSTSNTWSTVGQWLADCDNWLICINRKLVNCLPRCQWSVNWGSTVVSMECWSRIHQVSMESWTRASLDTQQRLPLVHMIQNPNLKPIGLNYLDLVIFRMSSKLLEIFRHVQMWSLSYHWQ